MKNNNTFLMLKIPTSFLLEVRKRHINGNRSYLGAMYKDLDVTLSALNKLSLKLDNMGLIEKTSQGRINLIKLTERGMEIADILNKIDIILNGKRKTR